MHKSNFVVCVKTGGKILREKKDQVALPFGSEYSLLLKNLESRRAQVKVSIDGDDVTGSRWLIIQPNGTLELERFIRNDNLKEGNRFKFIERTDAVEAGRGIKADDGLIRVEFKYEQVWNWPIVTSYVNFPTTNWQGQTIRSNGFSTTGTSTTDSGVSNNSVTVASCSLGAMQQSQQNAQLNSGKNEDIGITVPGSKSDQQFYDSYGFVCGPSEVITLHLVGLPSCGRAPVAREKQVCITCTKRNKSYANFCSQCGTALELF